MKLLPGSCALLQQAGVARKSLCSRLARESTEHGKGKAQSMVAEEASLHELQGAMQHLSKAHLEVTLNQYRCQPSTASKLQKAERQISRGAGNVNRDYDVACWLARNLQNRKSVKAELEVALSSCRAVQQER